MADNTLVITDSSSGRNLAELPWSGMRRNRLLSGAGQLSCSLPIEHSAVTEENLGQLRATPDREVTLFRNGLPKWNGPVSGTDCSWADGVFNLVAREASWYFVKRVLEVDKDYNGMDVFDVVRDLVDYMTTKTSTGDDGLTLGDDIVAAIPRFFVDPASTDAGATFTFASTPTIYGTDRKFIQDIIDLLRSDPETGFEFYMDYSTGSTWQSCRRTMKLAYPAFSNTISRAMTHTILSDYGRTNDWERAGTRAHVFTNAGPVVRQSALAVTNSVILLEVVDDRGDVPEEMGAARAKDLKRLSRPPVRAFTASYIPDDALPYGFAELGDTWPFEITEPAILSITADHRRVIAEDVACDVDGSESITYTFNDPLDDLGT